MRVAFRNKKVLLLAIFFLEGFFFVQEVSFPSLFCV